MKIVRVEREISHKINIGGFETICPTIRLTAELDEDDSRSGAIAELNEVILEAWSKLALEEMRIVHKRRNLAPVDKDPERLDHVIAAYKEMIREQMK